MSMSHPASDESTQFASNTVLLISSLTLYYFVEQCLRVLTLSYNPCFYEKLQASRKDRVFFGIAMGLIITSLSTPSCAYAALEAWNSSIDSDYLGFHSRVCITSRGVLWVSELNRLDMYGLYVLHHTGSIISLVSWLHFQWPNLHFFILFTTLVSEIPGDLVFMVSAYRETLAEVVPKLERFRIRLIRFNALQYTLIRGAGIFAVTWMTWSDAPGIYYHPIAEQLFGYGLLAMYSAFCASYVLRQLKSRQTTPSVIASHPVASKKIANVAKTMG